MEVIFAISGVCRSSQQKYHYVGL